jgi:hypothetical protein
MKRILSVLAGLMTAACSAADESASTRIPPDGNGFVEDPVAQGGASAGPSGRNVAPGSFAPGDAVTGAGTERNCGLTSFAVARRPTDILLVLDRSGSMLEPPEGGPEDLTKWDLTVPALNQVLLETDTAVSWGMKLFPEGRDTDSCSAATISDAIHVPIAPRNAAAVVGAIGATTADGDGTPTGDAIHAGVKYLSALPQNSRKYIVLATDGEPSCSPSGEGQDDARPYAVAAVTEALALGIPVFVVGVATTKDTATEALDAMALAGGAPRPDPNPLAPRYYLANTEDELVSALRVITGEIATCIFPLSAPPPVPDNIGVKVGGTLVPRDATRTDGWEYIDSSLGEIQVYGPWCGEIQAATVSDVQVIYACEGVIIR